MILAKEQVEALPNGTILKLFYSGSDWEEDFGKVFNVVKVNNKLYHLDNSIFDNIEDLGINDGYEIEAAIKEPIRK